MDAAWILGAGGHAKVVIDTLRACGAWNLEGILDDDPDRQGDNLLGIPVQGGITEESIARFGIRRAVIAIGSNETRAKIARRFSNQMTWLTAIHPRAYLAAEVRIGEGTVIFAGAVVQPGTSVGRHAILNTSCSIDHDCTIGDYVHVAPGAHLAAAVSVEEGAMLGLGCGAIPGRTIGAWAMIGAGGMVVHDIAARTVARGIPARTT